jgi:hypothetical protein
LPGCGCTKPRRATRFSHCARNALRDAAPSYVPRGSFGVPHVQRLESSLVVEEVLVKRKKIESDSVVAGDVGQKQGDPDQEKIPATAFNSIDRYKSRKHRLPSV